MAYTFKDDEELPYQQLSPTREEIEVARTIGLFVCCLFIVCLVLNVQMYDDHHDGKDRNTFRNFIYYLYTRCEGVNNYWNKEEEE